MNNRNRYLADLASFAAVLLVAWAEGWTPGQLAWGLWVSSYVMVTVWLAIMAVYVAHEDGYRPRKLAGTVFGIVFFAWMLVWMYRFYGELLDLAFPLIPDPGRIHVRGTTWRNVRPFEFWPTLVAGVQQCYVIVITSLLPLISGVRRTWPDAVEFRLDPGFRGGAFVRLHFTVMALMALQIVFQDNPGSYLFWFSAAVLTINNFPWYVFTRPAVGGEELQRRAPDSQ